MKNKFFFFGLLTSVLLTISCEDDLAPVPDADMIVVRAYIYAGQPVKDVILMSTLALDDESEIAVPIDSAEVILSRGLEQFTLVPAVSYTHLTLPTKA